MTAEVAILNRSAVALAADSKVSIGGTRTEKTYDTQNKIFTLSKIHPVGILIYNNADFMEYPWETIIKLYRAQKKDKSERTIENWGEDFKRFLKQFGEIRQKDIAENVRGVLISVFDNVEDMAFQEAHVSRIAIPSSDYENLLIAILEEGIEELRGRRRIISNTRAREVLKKYGSELLKAVARFVPSARNKKLIDAAIEFGGLHLIADAFSPASSGIVIAGFGSSEIFPSMVTYETDGYIGSQIKFSKPDLTVITKENGSTVSAFAQHDIAHRFMEGIDPDYGRYLEGSIRTALVEGSLKLFEKFASPSKKNDKNRRSIVLAAERQFTRIHDEAIEYRRKEFWYPTVEMVSLLPKDEIAHLAESLVELTSLHRRVSRELETVGGAIDVAVISKSDGFVWVKRKHYFEPELNPQFNLNYMRDIEPRRKS
jgi:hypothetical protein